MWIFSGFEVDAAKSQHLWENHKNKTESFPHSKVFAERVFNVCRIQTMYISSFLILRIIIEKKNKTLIVVHLSFLY